MARENQRRTEHAWKDRASEASEQQLRAAGKNPDGGEGQQGGTPMFGDDPSRPAHVRIVGGDAEFFAGMRRAFGMGDEAQTVSSSESAVESGSGTSATSIGPRVDQGQEGWLGSSDLRSSGFGRGPGWEPPPSFQAGLSQEGAQSQAALQLTQEMSLGGMMASQSTVPGASEALASYTTVQSGQSLGQGGDRVAEMAATLQASYEQQTRIADAISELTSQITTMVGGSRGGGGPQQASAAPVPLAPISPPQASQALGESGQSGMPMSPERAEQIPSFAQGGLVGPSQAQQRLGRGPSSHVLPAQRTPDTRPPAPQASGAGRDGQERLILAHVGESVLNREATKLVGPERVLALNRQASGQRSGGQTDRLSGLTGFARGGVVEVETDRPRHLTQLQRPHGDTGGPTTAVGPDGKGGMPSPGPRTANQVAHPTSPPAQRGGGGAGTARQSPPTATFSAPDPSGTRGERGRGAGAGGGGKPPGSGLPPGLAGASGKPGRGRGGDGAAAGGGQQPPGSGAPPGPPGASGQFGSGGDDPPLRVHVVSADDAFFEAFSQVFGDGGTGSGFGTGKPGGPQRPSGRRSRAGGGAATAGDGGDDQDDLREGPTAGQKRSRARQRETDDAHLQEEYKKNFGAQPDERSLEDMRQMWQGSPQMQAQVAGMSSVGAMKYRSRQRLGSHIQQKWGYESPEAPKTTEIKGPEGGFGGYKVQHPGQEEPEIVEPGTERAQAVHRDDQKRSAASTAGHAMAQYGAGAALRSLPGVVPVVGTAAMAANSVNKGAEFAVGQQAQNQGYQSIYGGSNWGGSSPAGAAGAGVSGFFSGLRGGGGGETSGFGNRMAEQGYVMKNRFSMGMDEQQSRQMFRGVAETGYTGPQRQKALEFGESNAKQMGMGPDQSLKLVSANAKNAANSFGQLQKSLQNVTKTAKETGQNANQMRETFTQLFSVNANQLGLGSQSGPTAERDTRIAGSSRASQGTEQMTAGLTQGWGNQQILASQAGFQNFDQMTVANEKDPSILPKAQTQRLNQLLPGLTPDSLDKQAQEFVKGKGGPKAFEGKGGEANQKELSDMVRGSGQFDTNVIRESLVASGIDAKNWTPEQIAASYTGNQYLGRTPEAEHNKMREERRQKPLTPEEKQGSGMLGDIGHAFKTFGSDSGALPGARKAIQEQTPALGAQSPEDVQKMDVLTGWANVEEKTGNRSAAMEEFSTSHGSNLGGRFKVETKEGPRFVDAATASRDYSDQLMSGKATIEGGSEHGKPAVTPDTDYKPKPEEDTTKQDPKGGMDQGQFEEEQKNKKPEEQAGGGGPSVKVHVEPGPKLQELLQFSGDNVTTSGGAQSGDAPSASGGVIGGSSM